MHVHMYLCTFDFLWLAGLRSIMSWISVTFIVIWHQLKVKCLQSQVEEQQRGNQNKITKGTSNQEMWLW